jgi:anti-sigma B factor antagonist
LGSSIGISAEQFKITHTELGGMRGVAVAGELDVTTCGRLAATLVGASRDDERVLLDLGECTFIDSLGLDAIADAAKWLDEDGRKLVVCNVAGQIERLLRLIGLDALNGLLVYPGSPTDEITAAR